MSWENNKTFFLWSFVLSFIIILYVLHNKMASKGGPVKSKDEKKKILHTWSREKGDYTSQCKLHYTGRTFLFLK